jgi:hypothetical protein
LTGTRRGNNQLNIFFNLERKNGQNKLWQKIRGLDGNLKYDIDEILDEQINFYANLFSTEGWDKNVAEELVTHMDKKLTCDESEDLEKDLTINEIKKIIFSILPSRPLIFCHNLFCPFFLSILKKYLVDCSPFSYQSTKLEKKSFSNLREWWDIAKIKIKSITIEASKKVNTTDDKKVPDPLVISHTFNFIILIS